MLRPDGNLIEISYEELKSDTFNTIRRIYTEISLPGFELTADSLLLQLEVERNYQGFQHQYCAEGLGKIEENWGKYIRQWNYKAV